jgi:hypothetical protein
VTTDTGTTFDVDQITAGLAGDGIIALKQAFPPEWADTMRADIEAAFEDAIARPGL